MATEDNPRNSKYPWDQWFDKLRSSKRGELELKKDTHYECATHAMSVQVRRAAKKRNVNLGVEIRESSLLLKRK